MNWVRFINPKHIIAFEHGFIAYEDNETVIFKKVK